MNWTERFLDWLAPNFSWRRKCPETIEQIAEDFVDNHCPPIDEMSLSLFDRIHDGDPWFAWRRRISTIYGIAEEFADPRNRPQRGGWNRRLWKQYDSYLPDDLVEIAFDATIQLVCSRLRDSENGG